MASRKQPNLQLFEFESVHYRKRCWDIFNPKGYSTKRIKRKVVCFEEILKPYVSLPMVIIPPGKFTMGAPRFESGRQRCERPQHKVSIPCFYMAMYPVTFDHWEAVMYRNPLLLKGGGNGKKPVFVTYFDALDFCKGLSDITGHSYRLPTEAEWEYACRAGTKSAYHFGDFVEIGFADCQHPISDMVGHYPPNPFGLCDMHYTTNQWCFDHWHENYKNAPLDGSAWITDGDSTKRVTRGGGEWNSSYYKITPRSASRQSNDPDKGAGFRVVCDAFHADI